MTKHDPSPDNDMERINILSDMTGVHMHMRRDGDEPVPTFSRYLRADEAERLADLLLWHAAQARAARADYFQKHPNETDLCPHVTGTP